MKLKIKIKPDRTVVKVLIGNAEELVHRELSILSANTIKNFMYPTLKNGVLFYRYSIEYVGPPSVPLVQYLRTTISREVFYGIVAQVVTAVQSLQRSNMSLKSLKADLRYIFINTSTFELFFVYIPVLSDNGADDLLDFFGKLLHSTNPVPNENNGYLRDFAAFLKSQGIFSADAFAAYISGASEQAAALLRRLTAGSGGADRPAESHVHYGGPTGPGGMSNGMSTVFYGGTSGGVSTGMSGGMTSTVPGGAPSTMTPGPLPGTMPANTFNEDTTLLNTGAGYYPDGASADTVLLTSTADGGGEGTTVLDAGDYYGRPAPKIPYLIRTSTNERININKPVFRLGKESHCVDYFVSNNKAVSRSHANIVTRGDHYFVMDLRSTNYTYINDAMIPEQVEVEIFDGNSLRLANEEFVFHVQ